MNSSSSESEFPDPPIDHRLRQILIALVPRLNPGLRKDLFYRTANELLASHQMERLDFSTSVQRLTEEKQEDWELCSGDVVTLRLHTVGNNTSLPVSVTACVGLPDLEQASFYRRLSSPREPPSKNETLILIGMPGSGKSTVGRALSRSMKYPFIDLDNVIESRAGQTLEKIIAEIGFDEFLELEAEAAREFQENNVVLATGGSVVYKPAAMLALREMGTIIYLQTPVKELHQRLSDLTQRGVVLQKSQSLEDLYQEREPLYECYYDIKVTTSDLSVEQTVTEILSRLASA